MGFHGWAAASKPYITNCNVKHAAAGLWNRGDVFSGVMTHASLPGNPMYEFSVWRYPRNRYLPDCIVPSIKFGGERVTVWGCFQGLGLAPWLRRKELLMHLHSKTFWTWPLPVPTWQSTSAQNKVHEDMDVSGFGAEELDWPPQSPDFKPIEGLWDELEWRLRASPSFQHWLYKCASGRMVQNFHKHTPKPCRSCLNCNGGGQLQIYPDGLRMRCH